MDTEDQVWQVFPPRIYQQSERRGLKSWSDIVPSATFHYIFPTRSSKDHEGGSIIIRRDH